ncbi:uncharacterized protein LOC126272415 [Schistocerca gregaria]|uniref:uncharacterized protein LOC126272415 n=1 Tax=Schistocerca gregaria TaxID=7010 RepID=UPI00211DDD26|nr:uncharacterized protein LOC126272415 [Schistocerca gregaria]
MRGLRSAMALRCACALLLCSAMTPHAENTASTPRNAVLSDGASTVPSGAPSRASTPDATVSSAVSSEAASSEATLLDATPGSSDPPTLAAAPTALLAESTTPPPTTTTAATTTSTTMSGGTWRPQQPQQQPQHSHYHVHAAGDGRRYGPYFEDGEGPHNVTARVGQTVVLDCRIGLLQGKTVSWLHRRHDALQLLTVGRQEYSADQRVTLSFRYPGNWRLRIEYVRLRDQGLYECQVATHPPRVLRIYLTVTAPEVSVTDEKGHLVSERYYKAGSAVELTCVATRLQGPHEAVVWRHGDATLTTGVSTNVTSADGSSVQSTLSIDRVHKRHSGNYTCDVGSVASTSVAVHILNGELPAAVQHNGAWSGGHWYARWPQLVMWLVPLLMVRLVPLWRDAPPLGPVSRGAAPCS